MADKVDVLSSASAFCDLLAAARFAKFPGHWSGSAYRRHPCGVIEGAVKLTNEWNTNNYCSIEITDGPGWSRDYGNDSFGQRDPHPAPLQGNAVVVWSDGRWKSEAFRSALEPQMQALVLRMQSHVAEAAAKRDAEALEANRVARERRESIAAAALANVAALAGAA